MRQASNAQATTASFFFVDVPSATRSSPDASSIGNLLKKDQTANQSTNQSINQSTNQDRQETISTIKKGDWGERLVMANGCYGASANDRLPFPKTISYIVIIKNTNL